MFVIRGEDGTKIANTKKDGSTGKELTFSTMKEATGYLENLERTVPFMSWKIEEITKKGKGRK